MVAEMEDDSGEEEGQVQGGMTAEEKGSSILFPSPPFA